MKPKEANGGKYPKPVLVRHPYEGPRVVVRLEGLHQLINPLTSSGIEPGTFHLVA
jgi:hypothetical protein